MVYSLFALASSFRSRSSLGLSATLALAACSFGLVACGGGDEPSSEPESIEVAKSALQRDTSPQVSATALIAYAKSADALTADLHRAIAAESATNNIFISPYSISTAFSMLYGGALGATKAEIAKVFHFTVADSELHATANKVALDLEARAKKGGQGSDGKGFRVAVGNSFWGQKTMTWKTPYLDLLATEYGAGINLVDFMGESEKSRLAINAWTSAQTENRINDLLIEGAITPNTRSVLVNTIYFNAAWANPTESSTVDFGAVGAKSSIPAISVSGTFRRSTTTDAEAVAIPYEGNDVELVAVLPKADIASYEASLDGPKLDALFAGFAAKDVALSLPKLTIKGDSVSLKSTLNTLGLKTTFTDAADLTGITDGGMFVGDVIHQTFLKLDEKGTEAAGATAIANTGKGAPSELEKFEVNRPFLVFLRDIGTGAILFEGRIVAPSYAP